MLLLVAASAALFNAKFELPKFELPTFSSSAPPAAAVELRDKLIAGAPADASLSALADECAAACVPFRAELLGDGELWRASSIVRGEIPRWERRARALPFFKSTNRAGQAYSLEGGARVVNYGEVLGRKLYFKAEGTFSKAAKSPGNDGCCPQDYDVKISSGGFVLNGKEVPLPISGPGFLRVLYIDKDIRIFESPKDSPDVWEKSGLVVVQVRDALFDDPVEGDL